MKRALPLLLLLTTLLLAACDSNEAEDLSPVNLGEFRASITFDGGDRIDLAGLASASTFPVFVIDSLFVPGDSLATPDSSTSFLISLTDFDPTQGPTEQTFRSISFMQFDSERPAVGTYPIGGFDRSGFTALFTSADRSGGSRTVLASESGTLTVEVSTEERTAGSFTFRGSYTPLEGGGRRTAIITGTFDARFLDLGSPFLPLTEQADGV